MFERAIDNKLWKRFWIRLKNRFRNEKKPEVAPAYEPGVLKVCEELIRRGSAEKWRAAGSMFVLRKLADLSPDELAAVSKALDLKQLSQR